MQTGCHGPGEYTMKKNIISFLFPVFLAGICLLPLNAQDYLFHMEVSGAGSVVVDQSRVISPGMVYETRVTAGTEITLRTVPDDCGA